MENLQDHCPLILIKILIHNENAIWKVTSFPLADLLPDNLEGFYLYNGSLTEPQHCPEVVQVIQSQQFVWDQTLLAVDCGEEAGLLLFGSTDSFSCIIRG